MDVTRNMALKQKVISPTRWLPIGREQRYPALVIGHPAGIAVALPFEWRPPVGQNNEGEMRRYRDYAGERARQVLTLTDSGMPGKFVTPSLSAG